MTRRTVIVSACLLGLKTRHDGADARSDSVLSELAGHTVIPVCPEQLGGLPTPRPRAWIDGPTPAGAEGAAHDGPGGCVVDGHLRVVDETGAEQTERFVNGAYAVLDIARITGSTEAVLKERSPSCGVTETHTSISRVGTGPGVTTAVLMRSGIRVCGV